MAEVVGLTASVIAIIDLSAKIATLCIQYSTAVGNARADISRLQSKLDDLGVCLQAAQRLIDNPNQALATSRKLVDSLHGCRSELGQVQSRLDPGKARKMMRRLGLRALKWPFDSREVGRIVSSLEQYKQTIMLCLQVDQTTILLDIQQKLDRISIPPDQSARTPCFSVPFDRDPDFVDRPEMDTWLKAQFTGSAGRMAIVGMGGFGKSQIAIQFAHQVHNESPQTSVFWVYASSKPRFEEAYRTIAERLRLPRRHDPGIDVCGLVRDWLQTEEAGPWLMVLDNADDANLFHPITVSEGGISTEPLAAYLPKRRNGKILITSRSMGAAEKLTGSHKTIYQISTMDDAQGLQLFRNKLNRDFDKHAAVELLQALGRIPLAVTQAAAYINRRAPRVSVTTYLDTFRDSDKNKGSLLNKDAGDIRRDATVSNSVVTTWQVTFEHIRCERPSAANLLSFMSFFNPQGIPEFILHGYETDLPNQAESDAERDDFEEDLDLLRGYSLVSVAAARDVFEMHPLVQFCTRAWITEAGNAQRWRRVFLRSMSRHFPNGRFEAWPTCQILLPHVESVLKEEPASEECRRRWASLLSRCAFYMTGIGNYRAAEELNRKSVDARIKLRGKEHPATLRIMANQVAIYLCQGRWKDAEDLQVEVVEIAKRALGEEHPYTLRGISYLAWAYRGQGRLEEAEELSLGTVETNKRVRGEEHPSTLKSMTHLSRAYRAQGRLEEAEELILRVMETNKRVRGEDHPDTLGDLEDLAHIWKLCGRDEDALALMRKCLTLRQRVLGMEHPNTTLSATALARWENARLVGE